MKLPFEFGLKLFFRLLVPGFLLSLGLWPIFFSMIDLSGWQIKHEYQFGLLVVLSGFLIMLSDMPIYMLFEGRRYWPESIRQRFLNREQKELDFLKSKANVGRLNSIYAKKKLWNTNRTDAQLLAEIESEERLYQEAEFDLRQFPQDDQFEHHVRYPSRIGNIIEAFEGYPRRSYGMDAVFYWPRLWLKLDKETREEIDNQQALADSALYSSFALYLSGLIWMTYAVLFTVNSLVLRLAPGRTFGEFRVTLFDNLPNLALSWMLFPLFVLSGYGLYRVSFRIHSQFGEIFKAAFDDFSKKLDVNGLYKETAASYVSLRIDRKEKRAAVFRYLQHGLVKCYKCEIRMRPSDVKAHNCATSHLQSEDLHTSLPQRTRL